MKQLATIASSLLFSGCAMIAPALAATGGTTSVQDYSQHAADCLALLFTDPKAHAEQCGGPNFVVPDPPSGSTGFASCRNVAEIDPFGIDGVQYELVAYPALGCCPIGSLTAPAQWQPLGSKSLVWNEPVSLEVVATNCGPI